MIMDSLSSFVENQKKEFTEKEKGFPIFYQMFRQMGLPEDVIKFLLKKNEFPYKWLDDFGKLILESSQMPLKEPVNLPG